MNPLPLSRPKRARVTVAPSSPDSSVLTKEASSKVTTSRVVLQAQETSTLNNEMDTAQKPYLQEDGKRDWGSSQVKYEHGFSPYVVEASPSKKNFIDRGGFSAWPMMHSRNWLMPPSNGLELQLKPPQPKKSDGNCRLFGVPLFSEPPLTSHRSSTPEPVEADLQSQHSKSTDPKDHGKLHQSCPQRSWSCTKVHKQGIALGRSVDLAKFNDYDELIAELDKMFEFKGELIASEKSWLVVYTDQEGDMMLVGDDPWLEFCTMVRKIFIYTREEVQRMNSGSGIQKEGESVGDLDENVNVIL